MNDSLAVNLTRSALGGLPQRLVQDGVADEASMHAALQAATERKTSFITQLTLAGTAKARDVAVAASSEYGVPVLDLDALSVDLDAVRAVSDKLLAKHRVLPLFRRGKRLFIGVADPTNLHAIDEIKFQTGLAVEAIVVEDDKLQKAIDKAVEQVDSAEPGLQLGRRPALILRPSKSAAARKKPGAVEVGSRTTSKTRRSCASSNKVLLDAIRRGASDIHFEPYEKMFRVRFRMDGVLKEIAQPPVQLTAKICCAHQGHGEAGYRRAPRAAGWTHQDAPVQKSRHRFSRQ